ncbi:LCP family protein [Corynebacterium pseudotuberculosis]|uniref:LCP family protein n=1 Tax=Corynebacterium pseudotuberculosis TaxID=1719 RepID=UPI002B49759D|nr:LCP family protein [Corynebacterium pseudotuberculosis]MEB3107461.1 LCP family protein [Corynebacterium pseudotuberculosis]
MNPQEPQAGYGSRDEFMRDSQGNPLLDRYGRPVRRRGKSAPQRRPRRNAQAPQPEVTRFDSPAQPQRPQQYFPSAQEQQQLRQQQPPQSYVDPRGYQQSASFQPNRSFERHQAAIQQPSAPRPRRRILRPRGCLSSIAWLVVTVLVLSIAGTLWMDTKLNRTNARPTNRIASTAGTNWLLVGSDSRSGLSEADAQRLGTGGDLGSMRTDTIMLLHIPTSGKATLLSLPRDSYVSIPGYGMDKINAAFTYGGAPLLTQTVEGATGLRVDHYAEIGMGGLANVVDAVGGIEVCPAEPINDPLAALSINAGCQKVNGPTALGYVRTRATPLGDLDRVQRQREFFAALVNKLTSTSTFANPFRFFPTVSSVAGSFTVGNKDHVWHLLRVALAMREGVDTVTVPYSGFANYDVGNVVLWDKTAAEQLFASLR